MKPVESSSDDFRELYFEHVTRNIENSLPCSLPQHFSLGFFFQVTSSIGARNNPNTNAGKKDISSNDVGLVIVEPISFLPCFWTV